MKNKNLAYWIITILFAGFMAATSIPDILKMPDAVKFVTDLGYPLYFVPFIGVAKVLGAIAIVVPGFPRLKEWAYAGFAFDLIGAFYSQIAVNGFKPEVLFMLVFVGVLFASYALYHRKQKAVL